MGSDWQRSKLGDVIAVNPSRPLAKGSDSVYISMQQVETANRSVSEIDHRAFKGSGARFQNGDTLLARITPCLENGKTAYVDFLDDAEVGHGSTEFIVLSGIEGVSDDLFVYYLARYPEFRNFAIVRMEGSSGRQRVPAPTLKRYVFACPSYDEQRAIAHILGSLDDKIELNRRMNKTLEAMARAIFKSWFVDFDPVRAKAEGRDTGLPDDIAALFPDSFDDSELGEIPKGWKVKPLAGICKKPQYGFTASANDEVVGPKFLRIKDINKSDWIDWTTVPYCVIEQKNKDKYQLKLGDIVIARMADPGHAALIEESVDAVFASYLIRFRPLNDVYNRYLQYWLRSDVYWNLVRGHQTGSTRANLNAKVLSAFPALIPNPDLAESFNTHINPIRKKVVKNVKETNTIASLRDTILPKLISGELRVPDVEKFVEEAGL